MKKMTWREFKKLPTARQRQMVLDGTAPERPFLLKPGVYRTIFVLVALFGFFYWIGEEEKATDTDYAYMEKDTTTFILDDQLQDEVLRFESEKSDFYQEPERVEQPSSTSSRKSKVSDDIFSDVDRVESFIKRFHETAYKEARAKNLYGSVMMALAIYYTLPQVYSKETNEVRGNDYFGLGGSYDSPWYGWRAYSSLHKDQKFEDRMDIYAAIVQGGKFDPKGDEAAIKTVKKIWADYDLYNRIDGAGATDSYTDPNSSYVTKVPKKATETYTLEVKEKVKEIAEHAGNQYQAEVVVEEKEDGSGVVMYGVPTNPTVKRQVSTKPSNQNRYTKVPKQYLELLALSDFYAEDVLAWLNEGLTDEQIRARLRGN